MAEFNLSEHRAQRTRESKTLTMEESDTGDLVKYRLVAEWPAEAFDYAVEGKLGAAIRLLFEDPQEANDFMHRFRPSVDDLSDILTHVYGMGELGERLASGG